MAEVLRAEFVTTGANQNTWCCIKWSVRTSPPSWPRRRSAAPAVSCPPFIQGEFERYLSCGIFGTRLRPRPLAQTSAARGDSWLVGARSMLTSPATNVSTAAMPRPIRGASSIEVAVKSSVMSTPPIV